MRECKTGQRETSVNLNFTVEYTSSSKFDFQHSLTLKSTALLLHRSLSLCAHLVLHKLHQTQYTVIDDTVYSRPREREKKYANCHFIYAVYFHFSRYFKLSVLVPSIFDAALNNKHIKIPMHKLLHELFHRILRFWFGECISVACPFLEIILLRVPNLLVKDDIQSTQKKESNTIL